MRTSTIVQLVVGLTAGVVAVWVGLRLVENAKGGRAQPTAVAVVVASSEIPYGKQITSDMLETVHFGSFPLPEHFESVESVAGRVTATKIVRGTPILANMLASPGTPPGAQYQITSGFRAEPVLVKPQYVLDLDPGDRVDVLYSPNESLGRGRSVRKTETILQNISVFSVGDRRIGAEAVTDGGDDDRAGRRSVAAVDRFHGSVPVKLLVPIRDVQTLREAHLNGTIELSKRAAGDDTIYELKKPEVEEPPPAVAVAPPVVKQLAPVEPMTHPARTVKIFEGRESPRTVEFPDSEGKAGIVSNADGYVGNDQGGSSDEDDEPDVLDEPD